MCSHCLWGFVIGHRFAMHYLVAFYFCKYLAEERIAGCFTLMVFFLLSVFGAVRLFLTVSWVGLHPVIASHRLCRQLYRNFHTV